MMDQRARVPYWGPPYREWFCKRAGITYLAPGPDCPCCVLRATPDEEGQSNA